MFSPPEHEPAAQIRDMSAAAAIHLLHMHKYKLFRLGKAPGLKPRIATPEEAEQAMKRAARLVESWMKRNGVD